MGPQGWNGPILMVFSLSSHQENTMTSPSPLTLTIFGGSGATGKAAVETALSRGHTVRTVEREESANTSGNARLTHHTADVLSDDLDSVIADSDAVLSCLGVGNDPKTLLSPPPLYAKGTARICDAMEAEGVKRLIVMSATFVATSDRGPIWFKIPALTALSQVFEQMQEMEDMLHQRDSLDWTAVRPGWLMEGDGTDDYTVQADVIPEGMIRTRRADVGAFMAKLAEGTEWARQTPAIARHEAPSASGPDEVVREMLG
jgi:nucleoside-diphosphate-sugar epimerase